MLKQILILLTLTIIASCSTDDVAIVDPSTTPTDSIPTPNDSIPNPPPIAPLTPDSILLKRLVISGATVIGSVDTLDYVYDGLKLTKIQGDENVEFTYTDSLITQIFHSFDFSNRLDLLDYDDAGRLSGVAVYFASVFSRTIDFVYNEDNTVTYEINNVNDTTPTEWGQITLSQGRPTKLERHYWVFVYSPSGASNSYVVHEVLYYMYDYKKNPLRNVIGLDKITLLNLVNIRMYDGIYVGGPNNVVGTIAGAYTYNEYDYPLNVVRSTTYNKQYFYE